mmetsp:Transcript_22392/g.43912  ORF Transcript_22392/g.43912 Transcript_22392/m.43912 type:complete len:209 (-) Transcript_22392:451-1077(-)
MTNTCLEAVQDDLRQVIRFGCMTPNILSMLDTADLEKHGRSHRQMNYEHLVALLGLLTEDNKMSELFVVGPLLNIIECVLTTRVKERVREHDHKVRDEFEEGARRPRAGGDHELGLFHVAKVFGKFILFLVRNDFIVIGSHDSIIWFTLRVQCLRGLLRGCLFAKLLSLALPLQLALLLSLFLINLKTLAHLGTLGLVTNQVHVHHGF